MYTTVDQQNMYRDSQTYMRENKYQTTLKKFLVLTYNLKQFTEKGK